MDSLAYVSGVMLLSYCMGGLDFLLFGKFPTLFSPPAMKQTPCTDPSRAEYYLPGQPVRYVPEHAEGDAAHPDCQDGFVSSRNVEAQWVYVRFTLGGTAEACRPYQLVNPPSTTSR